MPIPVPPLADQQQFALRAEQLATSRRGVTHAATSDDELFASLQSRAFRGEL
jgi:type I restriction enzyme S subunit